MHKKKLTLRPEDAAMLTRQHYGLDCMRAELGGRAEPTRQQKERERAVQALAGVFRHDPGLAAASASLGPLEPPPEPPPEPPLDAAGLRARVAEEARLFSGSKPA